ncbi:MAG: hypothetical protein LBP72_01430 [Dysgonamonadaceae bacterium]|jgi:hypothetical protein|nr:hypothetical protein [Dysgonamonadaceae bacterium]
MDKELIKKNADKLNKYILSLEREEQNLFVCTLANEMDISIQSIQNLRYGLGGLGKLKREKIEQVAGVKIFGEE